MIVELTMSVTVSLPEGSASIDLTGGRGWVLPGGEQIKVWAVAELNGQKDLTWEEATALGIIIEDGITSVEIKEEQEA